MNYEKYAARVRRMNPIDDDFLKKGKTTYHIDRVIRETGDVVYNGFSEIYVNAYVKDGSPTAELMTIFTEDDAYDDRKFPATSQRKRYFKEDEKGVSEMSAIMQDIVQEIVQDIKEEVREEGREEGRIETIVAMYHDGDITLQKACKHLSLTEEEFLEKAKKYQK